MSTLSDLRSADTTAAPPSAQVSRAAAWRIALYAASFLFAIGWTLSLGKDVHWDAVNYHLYLGFSAFNDRFALDFFGAGTPSYLNPYAYVPLYLMTRAELPGMAIAIAFAVFHALVLVLTYEIALVAAGRDTTRQARCFAVFAVLLAVCNPILLQSLGSTIIDLSTGVLVLAGWLCAARAVRSGDWRVAAAAGALCGAAAALKLSNAIFAVAALPMLLFVAGPLAHRVRAGMAFGLACAVVFAGIAAPWAWRLWEEFRNPLFPFFNHWFASPDFTDAPLRYERFLAQDWKGFLMRPFRMLEVDTLVHTEPRAPDGRYAALLLALAAWGVLAVRDRHGGVSSAKAPADGGSNRVLGALSSGFLAAWILWLSSSGNSRYFLPMACIASVVLAVVLHRLHARRADFTVTAAALVLAVQLTQLIMAADLKREGTSWQGPWLEVRVPERFRDEPHLFLSAAYLSGSAFAPYVHPASGFMNITGFNPLGPGHPGGERAQSLIARNLDRVRILIPLPATYVDDAPLPNPPEHLTIHVRRFGLRVDPSDCAVMKIAGNLRGALQKRGATDATAWTNFATCRLVAAPEEAAAYAREVRIVDAVFDRIEDACPNLFHPRRPVTEQLPMWVRLYNMGSEIQLWVEHGKVQYFSPVARGEPIGIGTVDEWLAGGRPIDCSRKSAPAFGGLLE